VAQITTIADANEPQPFQTFTPTKSLSNSVTYEGYTLTLRTNASTQYYGIELSGNGAQADSQHFGPSASVGGARLRPGVLISGGILFSGSRFRTLTGVMPGTDTKLRSAHPAPFRHCSRLDWCNRRLHKSRRPQSGAAACRRVGHIGHTGDVAEWLKAAVC
jgi:hypothetical protein